MEGHDSGHAGLEPPAGFSWQTYVEHFVTELGGWTALADEVVRRASGTADAPDLCRMVPADEARAINERAARLAKLLEDEDLLRRVARGARAIEPA